MALFTILSVQDRDGALLIGVQHFSPDGSPWFIEEYQFQGREGDKHKRASNADGELLLDGSGAVAPKTEDEDGREYQYLPAGAAWRYQSVPHLVDESILDVIRTVHAEGRPQGYDGRRPGPLGTPIAARDATGVAKLTTAFSRLEGVSYDR